jgi:hypothetical protein
MVRHRPEAAKAAGNTRLQKLNLHTARSTMLMLMLMQGRADSSPEKTVALRSFKKESDGDFLIDSVTHTYSGRSRETEVEPNAGSKGKAKFGHGKKPARKIHLIVPSPVK